MDKLQRAAHRLRKAAGTFSGYINYVCKGEIWPDAEGLKDYLDVLKYELSSIETALNKLFEEVD